MKRPGAPTPSVAAARAELEAARRCFDLPLRGEDAGRTQQAYTTRIDAFVREAATSTRIKGCPPFALVALGGYGREEMAPFSDIDLLFLTGTEWEARWLPFPEALHRRLWDLGLPVGFSIRSIETALADAREDLVFQTALLDRRFVGGDPERFEAFDARLRVEVHAPQIEAFVAAKLAEQERRRTRYGDSVYILEPNVRDGAGGLRDYHLLRWLATLFFPRLPFEELPSAGKMAPESFQALTRAVAFLWKVRHHLHRHFRRKNDHLRFEAQERIADRLGFRETKSALAVEHFMRTFYLHARTVERETGRWIETWLEGRSPAPPAGNRRERKQLAEGFVIMEGRLTLEDDRLLRESPERLVTLFREMAHSDVTLHPTLKGMIRAHRFRLDSGVQRHPAAREAFFEILRSPRAFRVLEEMHDLGILVRWIPEFRKVVCKMQHDLYHVYTVDRHLLFTVKHLLSLLPGGGDEWGSFVRWTPEMETMRPVLLLAGLLHDIGKGDGPGHASRGATIVRTIGERLGMSPEAIDLLVFLVSEHLRMAHISQR
ncbi:MAG: HD domain-containing protein, partial [Deltaproteobacteria bacterium]